MALAVVFAALLGAACVPSPRSPAHDGAGAPSGRSDGTILSLHPLLVTERSEYFALAYLSSGLRVNGFLGRPREGSGPRPAVVWNRGGNRELGAIDARVLVPYVEAGYVAVASQYRGNGGSEGREAFGGEDVEDVLNLVALLKRRPDVDASRIGMVGYSRGGMMTYRALREDARRGLDGIRAAAAVGGLADLDDQLDERPDMLAVYLGTIGCGPWLCPEEYVARSAVHWAGELRAPLLLLHGEADAQVSVEQSRRLAAALRAAGRPVKLVTFPGDDHGLSGHGHGLPEILAWLGAHLDMPPETYADERLARRIDDVLKAWPGTVGGSRSEVVGPAHP